MNPAEYRPIGDPTKPASPPVLARAVRPMVAVVARTDPAEQESVVVLDLPARLESVLAGFPIAADG